MGPLVEERDSIAEPLYALLSEVFDMRGVFRWLRRTLVTFVQITYGRTINRYQNATRGTSLDRIHTRGFMCGTDSTH